GTTVTVNGGGFGSNKTLTVKWDGSGGTTVGSCNSNGGGNIQGTCQFTVPAASDGSHIVFVTDGTTSFSPTFTVDNTAPITASVTTPANSSTFGAGTVPATFSGSAADNSGGLGMNADTTTFTLQRPDNQYWTGSAWQVGVFNLATTHVATTGNTAASWSGNVTLPTWASQTSGTYTVQAKATDKAVNTFTGSAVTFTLDTTAP